MFEHLMIAVATICRVLLITVAGMATGTQYIGGRITVQSMGTLISKIFLPSLLVAKLIDNLSYDMMRECYVLFLFPVAVALVGFLCALALVRCFVSAETLAIYGSELYLLGSFCHNAAAFPLGIMLTLRGVAWFDSEIAMVYVFVYNIVPVLVLWGAGPAVVARAVARRRADECIDSMRGQGAVAKDPPNTAVADGAAQSDQQKAIGQCDFCRFIAPVVSTPVAATLVSLAICAVPAVQHFIKTQSPLSIVLAGLRTVGGGLIPLTLLGLGTNITASDSNLQGSEGMKSESPNGAKEFAGELQAVSCAGTFPDVVSSPEHTAARSRNTTNIEDAKRAPLSMHFIVCAVKLVLTPLIIGGMFIGLARLGFIPSSKNIRFVILVESCSPTAINSALICAMHSYNARLYSTVVISSHCAAMFTSSLWIGLYLWYLQ